MDQKGTRAVNDGDTATIPLEGRMDVNVTDKAAATQLLLAAYDGDIATVRRLVTKGRVDVNVKDKDNTTAVYVASENGHHGVVLSLLGAGADVNIATSDNGVTPLVSASYKGHLEIVKSLIEAGANVNHTTKNNTTAVYVASQNGHHGVVLSLLGAGADFNITESNNGATPLVIASENGHLEIVKSLFEAGANVNHTMKDNATAVYMASQNGHHGVVLNLLGAGADVNIATYVNGATPLVIASHKGHLEIVKSLIEAGANVNHIAKDNRTAVYVASENGHHGVVLSLWGAGADVNIARSYNGATPLVIASENGHLEIVKSLIEAGTNVNHTTKDNATAVYVASENGHHGVVLSLLGAGADVNIARSDDGQTALQMSSKNGHTDTVVAILERGADIDARDKDDNTSLLLSSKNGHTATVVLLLELGANINARDKHGHTALHVAGNVETARALIAAGADLNAKDEASITPSYFAVMQGRTAVAQELTSLAWNLDSVKATRDVEDTMNNAFRVNFQLESDDLDDDDQVVLDDETPAPESDDQDDYEIVLDHETQATVAKQLYEEAMKFGSVKLSIIKCLVLGIAGVGKTCLKRLLLQIPQNIDGPIGRVSTGLADNPIQALVGSVSSILASVVEGDTGIWEVLDETKLMKVIASAYQADSSHPATPPPASTMPRVAINVSALDNTESHNRHVPTMSPPNNLYVNTIASGNELALDPAIQEIDSLIIEVFKSKLSDWKELNVKLIHFIDSGGQPQFLELLPAFVQDLSAILYAVNLSEPLDHHPMIYFYGQDCKPLGKPYQSPSSHKQVLHQCVRATYTGDVHPQVFVLGTHRDKENECLEKKKDKDIIIRQIVPPECLVEKNESEVIWDVNGIEPDSKDQGIANNLRQAIVSHCSKDASSPLLPMKWFVLEMQITRSAVQGVLTHNRCLQRAQKLGMDELGFEAALKHMVKYNLFLWYHKVPELRDIVISDPQVILKIITDLVECKHKLAALDDKGIKGIWRTKFQNHAIVSHEFLAHKHFEKHFIGHAFTIKHFIALMCHLFIMVRLGNDSSNGDNYLMPALLNPRLDKWVCDEKELVEPLLICFPKGCVPYGLFSSLVAFLQHKCCIVEKDNQIPDCLYKDCVRFKHRDFPAKFTIIDSISYIEVHLETGDCTKVCPKIRQLIHEGLGRCTKILLYNGLKDVNDGFICSNKLCRHAAVPYKDNTNIASCIHCHSDMDLTDQHIVWLNKESTQKQPKQVTIHGVPTLKLLTNLQIDGMKKIIKIIQKTNTRYTDIAMHLLNDDNCDIVRSLEVKYSHDPEKIIRDVYLKWIDGTGRPVTWETLVVVLKEIELHSLADEIGTALNL